VKDRKPDEAAPILSARGVVNRFGTVEIHDKVNLDVFPGDILGIAGGSGSGKSVLLRTLIGLRQPDAGEVLLNGAPVSGLAPAERAELIGVLFQQGALFSSLTVAQNILLPIRECTTLPSDEQDRIAAMKLELAGLSADAGLKFPSELSGGMVKRAALARAIALDPRLLFLDEPTSDLDSITATGIDDLIRELNESLGITVIVVTHDLTTLLTICTRIALLVDKRITVGTIEELKQSDNPWIRELLNGPRAEGVMTARKRNHGNG
jgi:phospholipid/cholesterol/gamma-HCH transport system ATP-binding protein